MIYLLILFLGLLGYAFKLFSLTFFCVVYLLILFGNYVSIDFSKKFETFKKDQITIRTHYLESFSVFYYAIRIIQFLTSCFYLYLFYFYSHEDHLNSLLINGFCLLTIVFFLAGCLDFTITLYIIFYKNHPVFDKLTSICYQCVITGLPMYGVWHISSNVLIIPPNSVSNAYHLYTPLGRGYGAWSSEQLLHIDYLKTRMGGSFDYKEIVDDNKMIDPTKLENYTKKHGFNIESVLKKKFQ